MYKFKDWADNTDGWGDEGQPSIELFSNAIQVWSSLQERDVSVADAAAAFNLSAERVREAVEWHYWLLLGPDAPDGTPIIQHEGV